jgi:hypothetical protein
MIANCIFMIVSPFVKKMVIPLTVGQERPR